MIQIHEHAQQSKMHQHTKQRKAMKTSKESFVQRLKNKLTNFFHTRKQFPLSPTKKGLKVKTLDISKNR